MSGNYPGDVTGNTPEAPWNHTADEPEPMDDATKIDVLLVAISKAKYCIIQGWPINARTILEAAEQEVLRD